VEVVKVERLYRIVFLGLFVVGFVGVIASADLEANRQTNKSVVAPVTSTSLGSLLEDIRTAQDVNEINAGRWNQDIQDVNHDSLVKVEALLADQR